MIIITNKTRGLRVVPRGDKKAVILLPGANSFADGSVDTSAHGFTHLEAAGDIEINLGTGKASLPEFGKLKRGDAVRLVQNTHDRASLEEFRAKTTDTQVIGAIKAQLAAIDEMEAQIAAAQAQKDAGNAGNESGAEDE